MKSSIKTDLWVRILLWATILMFIPMFFFVPAEEQWIMALSTVIMAIIILPLFKGTYEITEEELIITFYFFKQRIPLDNIKSIRKCSNWYSSAAMSKERIEVKEHHKGRLRGTTYISPNNREEFFLFLQSNCRNLEDGFKHSIWEE